MSRALTHEERMIFYGKMTIEDVRNVTGQDGDAMLSLLPPEHQALVLREAERMAQYYEDPTPKKRSPMPGSQYWVQFEEAEGGVRDDALWCKLAAVTLQLFYERCPWMIRVPNAGIRAQAQKKGWQEVTVKKNTKSLTRSLPKRDKNQMRGAAPRFYSNRNKRRPAE